MWVNGELRFSDQQLMRLHNALQLAMLQIDDASQGLTDADSKLAEELEDKAEGFLDLENQIAAQLAEKVYTSWP